MKVALLGAAAFLAIAAPALASPVTLPGTWFDIEIPSSWSDKGILEPDGADLLEGPGGAQAALYLGLSCQSIWDAFAKLKGATSDYGADFLPSGWAGKAVADDHVDCRDRSDDGSYAIAVRESASQIVERRDGFLSLFAAIDAGRFGNGLAYHDDVATLPGSGIRMHHADDFALIKSDPSTASDVFHLVVDGKTLELTVRASTMDCAAAVTSYAGQAAGTGDDSAPPWSRYQVGGTVFVCMNFGTTTVVIEGPSDRSEEIDLRFAISDEMQAPAALGPVQALPISKWRASVPAGWWVTSESVVDAVSDASDLGEGDDVDPSTIDTSHDTEDILAGPGGQAWVSRPDQSCDAVVAAHDRYDPIWLPSGWRAGADSSNGNRVFCMTGNGGTIEVHAGGGELLRPQLMLLLASLAAENAPPPAVLADLPVPPSRPNPGIMETPRPHGPYLPVPITLSLQTVGLGSDRGWGARVAAHYSRVLTERLSAQVGGELAYDTVTKLDHDLGGGVELFLSEHFSAQGLVGHDQLGTGDTVAIKGAWYYGFGGSIAFSGGRDGYVGLHLDYLWRSQPAMQGTTPVDTLYYPDHEWRLGAEVLTHRGRVDGVTAEYRSAGDASTILVGLVLRL